MNDTTEDVKALQDRIRELEKQADLRSEEFGDLLAENLELKSRLQRLERQ